MEEKKEDLQDVDIIKLPKKEDDIFYKHDYVTKLPNEEDLSFDIVNNFVDYLKDKDKIFEAIIIELEIQKRLFLNFIENSNELKNELLTFTKRIETFDEVTDEATGVTKRNFTNYTKIITDLNELNISIQINDNIFTFNKDFIIHKDSTYGDKEYKLYQIDFDKIDSILNKGNNLSLINNIKNTLYEINLKYKEYFDSARPISYITVNQEFYKTLLDNKSIYIENMKKGKVDKLINAGMRKRISEKYEKLGDFNKTDIIAIQDGLTKLNLLFNLAYHYVNTYKITDDNNINIKVFDNTPINKTIEDKLHHFMIKCVTYHVNKYPQDIPCIIYDTRFDGLDDMLLTDTFRNMVTLFLKFNE